MKLRLTTIAALALGILSAHAQAATYTTIAAGDYQTAGNWDNGVPVLTGTANTAVVNQVMTYNPGGDFSLNGGGTLEITTGGSWTQINGVAWIQLGGNGHILVDGGTFNQGTAGNNPFNLGGTGNTFTISSGAAYFNSSFNAGTALTYLQTGGTVNTVGEFDANSTTASMSGGILNTTLITTQNAIAGVDTFTFSGGVINLSSGFGIYGGNAKQINFTLGSTGVINFNGGTSLSAVQGMVTSGIIELNGTIDAGLADFSVTQPGGTGTPVILQLNQVPEPSVFASFAIGACGLLGLRRRRF
ncbi:MAG: PEP-CTERM sorting domain-containing protein [Verrucomicrobiota bacterium]